MAKSNRKFSYYITHEGHLQKYIVMSEKDSPIEKIKRQNRELFLCKLKYCLKYSKCDKKQIVGTKNNIKVKCINYETCQF